MSTGALQTHDKGRSLSESEHLLDELKIDVYTSLSNIQILNDLNKLIDERNRILLSNTVLFRSLIREFQLSLVVKLERLVESGRDRSGLPRAVVLADYYLHGLPNEKQRRVREAISRVDTITNHKNIHVNRIFRNKKFAHKDKDQSSLEGLRLDYSDYQSLYAQLGEILNSLSGAFFDKATSMRIVGDDMTFRQFQILDNAERAYSWLQRHEKPNHPAFHRLQEEH